MRHGTGDEVAEALSPEELEELKNHQKEALANQLVEGRWLANCPGQKNIHVKAASQSEAVALVCLYLACEPQQVVVAQCKRKALPRRGDRVLRAMPVAGAPDKTGYAYGIEPPE
jgi:hypothetical protein